MVDDLIYQHLRYNKIFSGLDSTTFQIVEDYFYFQPLETNEYLFQEGETGDYVAFLLHGRLEILKHDHQGEEVLISVMGPGDSIGEMAIIDKLSRSASVKASEKTGLVVLPKKNFERILHEHPQIGIDILKGIATMLSLNLRRTSEDLARKIDANL